MSKLSKAAEIVYPMTIVNDRYDGTYSGGKYTAWNLECYQVPDEIWADDVTCRNWWYRNDDVGAFPVGKGDTPNEAAEDLVRAIKAHTEDLLYQYDEIKIAESEEENERNTI